MRCDTFQWWYAKEIEKLHIALRTVYRHLTVFCKTFAKRYSFRKMLLYVLDDVSDKCISNNLVYFFSIISSSNTLISRILLSYHQKYMQFPSMYTYCIIAI